MDNPYKSETKVNPQKEDGHRQINNDCFHALMAMRLSGAVYQIILTVIDKTWGYSKHYTTISLNEFQAATHLTRQSVSQAIKRAEQLRIIIVGRDGTKCNTYMFNKYWDTWLASQVNHTSKDNQLVKQIIPNWSSKSHQSSQANHTRASQVAEPTTEPVNKYINKTINKTIKKGPVDKLIIPDYIDKALWEDFIDMRKKLRKPPTDRAQALLLKDLERYRQAGDDPNEILRMSIKNSWLGLFPLKKGGQNGTYKQVTTGHSGRYKTPEEYLSKRKGVATDK